MAYLSCRVRGGHMAYVKDNATDAFLKGKPTQLIVE